MPKKAMTYERWQDIAKASLTAAIRQHPGAETGALMRKVNAKMVEVYGPCPPEPPKPPWWARIALRVLRGKAERALEEKMDGKASKLPKWTLALVAGVAAIGGTVQAALTDNAISAQEWVAIANAFVVAAWAKFSNPEKVVSPKPTVK
jgi:hypothetical protein